MTFEQFYLGLVVFAFSSLFFTLMGVWIWARGWAPRPSVTTPVTPHHPHAAEAAQSPPGVAA